jgi:hypothetical protein
MKIKDRVTLGVIAGLGANIVKLGVEQFFVSRKMASQIGITKAAGIHLHKTDINSTRGKAVGILTDMTIAATLGVAGTYLLTHTGRDNKFLKALALGNISWSFMYGFLGSMGASSVKKSDPKTSLTQWFSHTAFSLTKLYLIDKLGDQRLFKPNPLNEAEKTLADDLDPTFPKFITRVVPPLMPCKFLPAS